MEEIWLKKKLSEYFDSPIDALEDMLLNTTHLMEQYMKNKNSATEGVVIQCIKLNKIFIEMISLEKNKKLELELNKLKNKNGKSSY